MTKREIDKSTQIERLHVEELDEILGWKFPVLDHGFVRVVDYMGDDTSIVQAARVSYGNGTTSVNEDTGLIRYLMRHKHETPTEMCNIKFHIKLPIFVMRQLVRHRISSLNEYSARYSVLDNEFYIPELKDLAKQSSSNNQGRGELLSEDYAKGAQSLLYNDSQQCYSSYLLLLNDYELARELARMNLTINSYTQIYWSLNLRSLFNFIKLRIDSHAQYEIRVYTQEIYNIVKKWVPISSKAFEDYTLNSVTLSDGAFNIIKDIINRNFVDFKNYNLSKREINELKKQFNIEEYIKKENKSLQFCTLK